MQERSSPEGMGPCISSRQLQRHQMLRCHKSRQRERLSLATQSVRPQSCFASSIFTITCAIHIHAPPLSSPLSSPRSSPLSFPNPVRIFLFSPCAPPFPLIHHPSYLWFHSSVLLLPLLPPTCIIHSPDPSLPRPSLPRPSIPPPPPQCRPPAGRPPATSLVPRGN